MKRRSLSAVQSIVGIALFITAILVLRHELRGHSFGEMLDALLRIPWWHLGLALLLTVLTYLVFTIYDVLALRHIGRHLAYRSVAAASFVGYALGNNVGCAPLACGSVRYRYYSAHGLTAVHVLEIVTFASLMFWLGFSSVAAIVFSLAPPGFSHSFGLPVTSVHMLGFLFSLLVACYLLWCALAKSRTFSLRSFSFRLPSLRFSLLQIVVASAEWLLTASILFVLLPHSHFLPFPQLVGIFLLAQVAGVASQVPAGFGVLEGTIIALLPPSVPVTTALASILVYRLFYNLLPLLVATLLLGIREVSDRRKCAAHP